jgi:hypothetical protein
MKKEQISNEDETNTAPHGGLATGTGRRFRHPRVSSSRTEAAEGRISPRYLLRCGCCGQNAEIYYDTDGLEINGVNGSLENWREILLPLLGIKQPKTAVR